MIVFQQTTKPLSTLDWAIVIHIHILAGKQQYIALILMISLPVIMRDIRISSRPK